MGNRKKVVKWKDFVNQEEKDKQKEENWKDERNKDVANKKRIKPKTPNQSIFFDAINQSTLTICTGPAGTGKSYLSCGVAIGYLLDGKIDKIIVSRPIVECGDGLGYLPGDIEQKTDPFMVPIFDSFSDFISKNEIKKLKESGAIEVCPLETMRGRTFHNSFIILDEAQNATKKQVKMFLTRLGLNSKMIVCGDKSQSDLPHNDGNPLDWIIKKLDHPEISKVFLTSEDVQRHGLVRYIIEKIGE